MPRETAAHVLSVNVGQVREVEWRGRRITSAIWKSPVRGRVALRGVNFSGDDQADRAVHGGRDKAVYAYSREDYDYWRNAEGVDTSPGLFGENLTTEGVDLSSVVTGSVGWSDRRCSRLRSRDFRASRSACAWTMRTFRG